MKHLTSVFLPGIIAPAVIRYGPLLKELGPEADAHTKELEVYSVTPPDGYSIAWEIDGLLTALERLGAPAVHLYGHSGGGAAALAFTAAHPDRVLSLTVDEPAFDFTDEGRAELEAWYELLDLLLSDPATAMPRFLRMELKPGVEFQPPAGPPPLPNRPAGVQALLRCFRTFAIDLEVLRGFDRPVLFTRGTLSNERYEHSSRRLAAIFPDFREEVFEGLSHLNTSHQAEPARVATLLRAHWSRVQEKV